MEVEAKFWKQKRADAIQCFLCPHQCVLKNGQKGICEVRVNKNNVLYTRNYGAVTSVANDPIEKKPLYHFRPGTLAFSLGTASCNFKCLYCQNYTIAAYDIKQVPYWYMSPESAVEKAIKNRCDGIAYTYNEPIIWYEYTYDTSKLAHEKGLYNVYVTNGYITEEPLKEIAPYLDAMNIDIKGSDEFYKKVCKAKLEPVLNTSKIAKELGIHIELTYLIVPEYNDKSEDFERFCDWVIDELDENVPVHFSRFFPYYKMKDLYPTPISTMLKAYTVARAKGINFVYLGNVGEMEYNNTYCPHCNHLLIERTGFGAMVVGLEGKKCKKCGKSIPIIL